MSDGMKILERIMGQAAARHRVIASNVANVDTPNYKAKDIAFDRVLGTEIGLAATDSKHLQPAGIVASGEVNVKDGQSWQDKNDVELDVEVAKMTENAMRYEAGAALLAKKIQMFKNALKTS